MWYTYDADVLTVYVYVQPGAKSTSIVGFHDDMPKIRLHSPAIDGRANKELQRYIAQLFGVPLKQVSLVRGEKSRRKTLKILGCSVDPESLF